MFYSGDAADPCTAIPTDAETIGAKGHLWGHVLSTRQVKLDGSRDSGNCDENRYTPVRLISLLVVILSVSIFSYLDGMKNIFLINIFCFKGKRS